MPTSPVSSVIDHIRRAVPSDGDGELLGRFVERRDETALAALVKRHGPMVWGVCRRLLGHHDAEDAFQATFIVLVRKAGSVKPRGMVGNWLYGVARQVALQARTTVRRRAREIQVTQMPDVEAPQDRWADVRPILDEELSRLPDHYRAVIVLCDLEGRTRKEVARQFGCPEGTVASRLSRAREMLANRLTGRGVALSGGALAALSQKVSGAVPASVVSSTIKAASLCAAGKAALPVKVAALTEGVLKAMLMSKLKAAVAVVLVLGVLAVGAIGVGFARGQTKDDAPQESEPKAQKDAVVNEKAEKKEAIAWGKEVDGLQIGLLADAGSYRQGEKLKLTVKLRNVGKAEVTVTYSVLRESPPQVTTADGGKVSVFMPAPFDNFAPPMKRAIKPGETINLYNPEVAVESEALMRLKGIMRVDAPTICVAPGKYKIEYGGMIQSHPKLATGTVEFEVKDQVAWGKEVDGVQVGILFGEDRVYKVGENVTLVLRIRNNGKEPVPFNPSDEYFYKNPPLITDADGKAVKIKAFSVFGIISQNSVAPGKEVDWVKLTLALRPATDREKEAAWTLYGTGKFHIQYEVVPVVGKPRLEAPVTTHATGKLELEVKDADEKKPVEPAAKQEKEKDKETFTAWGEEQPSGVQIGLGYLPGEKRVYSTGESVTIVVRARSVGRQDVQLEYVRDLWINYPPAIVDGDGKKYPMPKVITNIVQTPSQVTLKAGKETELYTMKLELRPAGEVDDKQVMKIFGTGKFQIHEEFGLIGRAWVGENRNAATDRTLPSGKLEIEVKEPGKVKQEKETEGFTEWGKEVGGLQAGLGFRPGAKRVRHHGEAVGVVLRVRNVGKEAVEFKHIYAFFVENPPTLTDADGKTVELRGLKALGLQRPRSTNLAPGKEVELYEWSFDLQPKGVIKRELLQIHGTGKFSLQCERVVGPTSANPNHPNPTLDKLATGKLELEVKEAEKK